MHREFQRRDKTSQRVVRAYQRQTVDSLREAVSANGSVSGLHEDI